MEECPAQVRHSECLCWRDCSAVLIMPSPRSHPHTNSTLDARYRRAHLVAQVSPPFVYWYTASLSPSVRARWDVHSWQVRINLSITNRHCHMRWTRLLHFRIRRWSCTFTEKTFILAWRPSAAFAKSECFHHRVCTMYPARLYVASHPQWSWKLVRSTWSSILTTWQVVVQVRPALVALQFLMPCCLPPLLGWSRQRATSLVALTLSHMGTI